MRVLGQRISPELAEQLGFERDSGDSGLSYCLQGNGRNYYLMLALDDDVIVSVNRFSVRHHVGHGRSSHGLEPITRFPQTISHHMTRLVRRLVEESRPLAAARQERLDGNEQYHADTAAFRVLQKCIGDVTCTRNAEGRIIGVDIVAWWRSISIPADIGRLSELQYLYCKCGELTGIPPEIGCLYRLKRLNIDSTQLHNLPDELGRLQALEILTVSSNRFPELPEVVTSLANLKNFSAHSCHMRSCPRTIGNLKRLTRLELCHNQLASLPEELGELTELEWLDVGYNQLASVPRQLGNLKKLRRLDVKQNNLQELPVELARLWSLQHYELLKDDTCEFERTDPSGESDRDTRREN